jgi:hypothetical protein
MLHGRTLHLSIAVLVVSAAPWARDVRRLAVACTGDGDMPSRMYLAAPVFLGESLSFISAAKPDFSGTWVLDRARSNGDALPSAMSFRIAQDSSTLHLRRTTTLAGGEDITALEYRLDGTPTVVSIKSGSVPQERTTSAEWLGDTLVLSSVTKAGESSLRAVERWTLDTGGGTLRVEAAIEAGGQHAKYALVLIRT